MDIAAPPSQSLSPSADHLREQGDHHSSSKLFVLILSIIGFGSVFLGGIYYQKYLREEQLTCPDCPLIHNPKPAISSSPQPHSSEIPQLSTQFNPGEYYFDDTVIFMQQEEPHRTLIATVSHKQDGDTYIQNTRVSFFDGLKWIRKQFSQQTVDATMVSNNILQSWEYRYEPSGVLQQTVEGVLVVDTNQIQFESDMLENEMSIRSTPGYTKFLSASTGKFMINSSSYPAYVALFKIYSLDASQIQFYTGDFGLITDWAVLWDQAGNFYHIDKTEVPKPTPIYQSHNLGILKTNSSSELSVSKTFAVSVQRDNQNPPHLYTFELPSPIGKTIQVERINKVDKVELENVDWLIGQAIGTVDDTVPVIGLVEYIRY
jgi:hypothetical protein